MQRLLSIQSIWQRFDIQFHQFSFLSSLFSFFFCLKKRHTPLTSQREFDEESSNFVIMEPPPGLLRGSSVSAVLYIAVIIFRSLLQAIAIPNRMNFLDITQSLRIVSTSKATIMQHYTMKTAPLM